MKNFNGLLVTLSNFERYSYEVAFDSFPASLLRRLLTKKSDYRNYYIRRTNKENGEVSLLTLRENTESSPYWDFLEPNYCWGQGGVFYWRTPEEPISIIKTSRNRLGKDTVVFTTESD